MKKKKITTTDKNFKTIVIAYLDRDFVIPCMPEDILENYQEAVLLYKEYLRVIKGIKV